MNHRCGMLLREFLRRLHSGQPRMKYDDHNRCISCFDHRVALERRIFWRLTLFSVSTGIRLRSIRDTNAEMSTHIGVLNKVTDRTFRQLLSQYGKEREMWINAYRTGLKGTFGERFVTDHEEQISTAADIGSNALLYNFRSGQSFVGTDSPDSILLGGDVDDDEVRRKG